MVISLKDDHVSAWQATYDGAKLLGGRHRFLLGGSGHNAGVINPPAANKHGYWTNAEMPATAEQWLETATRHEGSWWPEWQAWLVRDGGRAGEGAQAEEGIEPAPGAMCGCARPSSRESGISFGDVRLTGSRFRGNDEGKRHGATKRSWSSSAAR